MSNELIAALVLIVVLIWLIDLFTGGYFHR